MSKNGCILSLCDRTGNMVMPWVMAGWDAILVDLQHTGELRREHFQHCGGGTLYRVKADVREYKFEYDKPLYRAFGFPPCTDLATSGAVWWKKKGSVKYLEALDIVIATKKLCSQAKGWAIENPVGRLAAMWRPADYTFSHHEYAGWLPELDQESNAYSKRTCIWKGGDFIMPPKKPVAIPYHMKDYINNMCPSDHRADDRSITPMGFAIAVYETDKLRYPEYHD